MYLRPKTTRRLLIIAAVLLAFGVLAGTMWGVSARRSAERIAKARADAMAAFQRGDYAAALPHFSTYLTESKTHEKPAAEADVEALFAYGKSRRAVPMKNDRHVIEAINIFENYRNLRPDDREVQHQLLELYPRVKYNEEALTLADKVLAADPTDAYALRASVKALGHQRKFEKAMGFAERLAELRPNDLEAQVLVQDVMYAKQEPGERIVARFEALLAAHAGDARFEYLMARAHTVANRPEDAVRLLKAAAARNTSDPEVATALTRMLEHYRLFAESNQVLEHLAQVDGGEDPLHVRPLVRRMWQGGKYRDVVRRTERDADNLAAPTSDTELLAFRALALYDLNRPAEAAPIVAALAGRKDDVAAAAWATVLAAREDENLAPRERVKQFESALERAPDNEVIHFFIGEAYAGLGETEPAVRHWYEAARRAPSWAAPAAAAARTLAATGRTAEALTAAAAAYKRAPNALSTTTGYVVAAFAALQQNPDAERRSRLLEIVGKIQREVGREPETLHIYAALLSRSGDRDAALKVIRSALDEKDPAPRETLLQLSAVSFGEKLGVEREVLDFAVKVHGRTPDVAVREAVLLAQEGKPQAGLRLLAEAAANDKKSDPTLWAIAMLRYRESTGDGADADEVLAGWITLGNANPDSARVQQAILHSPSRYSDKAFWATTIDRLKKLAGERAVTPRVERARWLLSGETSEKDASEAIVLLREVGGGSSGAADAAPPEINHLLGLAHEKNAAHKTGTQRQGLLETAAERLNKALEARDADVDVATDLTRVYRALGRNADADAVMSRLAERAADLGVDGRKRTARTLVEQGNVRMAIGVLEPVADGQDPGRDAMLCTLYRRAGETEKAAALYLKAFDDQRTGPGVIADAADFFAQSGRPEEAERFLAKLRTMDAAPAPRALLLARHAERHGTPAEAVKGYEAAVAADPAYAPSWRALVAFHLRKLKLDEAVDAAERGLRAAPDDAALRSLRTRAVALQEFRDDPNIETLTSQLADDPQSAAVADMLRVMGEARRTGESLAGTLPKLRALADRHPDLLRLQMYVAQGHAALKQYDEAERVATRAASRAPNDADAARLLTAVYAARPGAEKWTKVLDAARQWRQRSLENPLAADVTIARALLELGQAQEAASQLAPHVAAPVKPDANRNLVGVYARALILTGRESQAADLLMPLAKESAAWRAVWLELGAASYDNAEDAAKWVDRVVPMLGDAVAERAALARTWVTIAARFPAAESVLAKAKAAIDPLMTDPKASIEGWRLRAMAAEVSGDASEAAAAYRKLLEAEPDNADVLNNLAYALLEVGRSEDLTEAQALAKRAVAKSPASATYLDTLARVQRRAGDLVAAEDAFGRALEAEPDSIDAMIGLADVHARAGRPEKAKELLVRINNALQGSREATLSVTLQRELDGVRQSVARPVQSGRAE